MLASAADPVGFYTPIFRILQHPESVHLYPQVYLLPLPLARLV